MQRTFRVNLEPTPHSNQQSYAAATSDMWRIVYQNLGKKSHFTTWRAKRALLILKVHDAQWLKCSHFLWFSNTGWRWVWDDSNHFKELWESEHFMMLWLRFQVQKFVGAKTANLLVCFGHPFFLGLYMKKEPNISTFTLSMQSKHEMLINRINEVSIGNVFLIVERRRRRSREKRWKRNWGLPFWLFSSLQF